MAKDLRRAERGDSERSDRIDADPATMENATEMRIASALGRVKRVSRLPTMDIHQLDLFGPQGVVAAGPQSFVAEIVTPDARMEPHFHQADQFQIFVAGDGQIGKHELHPVTCTTLTRSPRMSHCG